MILLKTILKEVLSSPKAIILAGGAGSGKSYIIKNYLGNLKNDVFIPKNSNVKFKYLNPDDIVEKEDLPLGSAMKAFREKFDDVKKQKENIIWDTTGANISNTINKTSGYDRFMVMVYTHPIISILQNVKRDRVIPFKAIIKIWSQVYNNVEDYKLKFKGNFFIINNEIPGYEKDIEAFNKSLQDGKDSLEQYLTQLTQTNPEQFKSTFDKPFNFKDKNTEINFTKALALTSYNEEQDVKIFKDLQKEFEKDETIDLEKKIKSLRNNEGKNLQHYGKALEDIIKILREFKHIKFSSKEEVQNKLKIWAES